MPSDELTLRIQRIYEAVNAVVETDISKFMPKVIKDGNRIGFYQDWSGGLSSAEIENIAHILIYNVANLKEHLREWAKSNGKDKTEVNVAFKGSQELKIIKDLSNNDRHGYDPKRRGNSGKSPRVEKFERVMCMSAGGKGSFISLTFNGQGVPQVSKSGTGEAKVIITGDILDRDGNKIGDLHETLLKAIKDWEKVLSEFGVQIPSN